MATFKNYARSTLTIIGYNGRSNIDIGPGEEIQVDSIFYILPSGIAAIFTDAEKQMINELNQKSKINTPVTPPVITPAPTLTPEPEIPMVVSIKPNVFSDETTSEDEE